MNREQRQTKRNQIRFWEQVWVWTPLERNLFLFKNGVMWTGRKNSSVFRSNNGSKWKRSNVNGAFVSVLGIDISNYREIFWNRLALDKGGSSTKLREGQPAKREPKVWLKVNSTKARENCYTSDWVNSLAFLLHNVMICMSAPYSDRNS